MTAKRTVIVHGVQTGTDEDAIKGPKVMAQLIASLVADRFPLRTEYPTYEGISDDTLARFKEASRLLVDSLTLGTLGVSAAKLVDLIGDVFLYNFTEKSREIRSHIRQTLDTDQCHVLAGHSLGSVVCFDIVNDLIKEGKFQGPRSTWPVQYLVTFGSPLSLRMFLNSRSLTELGEEKRLFWYNYFDRSDPVPAGTIFGTPRREFESIRKNFRDEEVDSWHIFDNVVDTGFNLLSHVNYWGNGDIGTRIAALLGRNS